MGLARVLAGDLVFRGSGLVGGIVYDSGVEKGEGEEEEKGEGRYVGRPLAAGGEVDGVADLAAETTACYVGVFGVRGGHF